MPFGDDIIAKMGLDARDFDKGFKEAEKKSESFAKKFGKAIGSINFASVATGAGVAVAAVGALSKVMIDAADELQDTSEALDLNVESMQRMRQAAAQTGVDAGKFTKAFGELNSKIDEAIKGNPKAIEAFKNVGVTLNQLKGLSPEEIFYRTADGIKQAKDHAEALNFTTAIYGEKAKGMVVILKQGGDAIKEQMGQATIASKEAIENLGRVADKIESWKSAMISFGIEAVNVLTNVANAAAKVPGLTTAVLGATPLGAAANLLQGGPSSGSSNNSGQLPQVEAGPKLEATLKNAPGAGRSSGSSTLANMSSEERQKRQMQRNAPGARRNSTSPTLAGTGPIDSGIERVTEGLEKSFAESFETEAAIQDETRKKNEEFQEKQANRIENAGSKFQNKVETAATKFETKIANILKTPSERRAERKAEGKVERAENRVEAQERSKRDSKKRGAYEKSPEAYTTHPDAYSNQEEREKKESDKRNRISGKPSENNTVGKQIEKLSTIAEEMTNLRKDFNAKYGKST